MIPSLLDEPLANSAHLQCAFAMIYKLTVEVIAVAYDAKNLEVWQAR